MRYYIIAGERSGDLHGSNLVKAIRQRDSEAEFRGIGGDYLRNEGVDLMLHYDEMAVMGVIEVLTSLYKLARLLNHCIDDIHDFQPHGVILIDYGAFNRRVAKRCKRVSIKAYYYIPPKVWAWRQDRAKGLKSSCEKLFVILPFEKDFYAKYEWEVDYVGNPVLDAVKSFHPNPRFNEENQFHKSQPLVALLPGSRKQEIASIVPLMRAIALKYPDCQFAVAGIENMKSLYSPIEGLENVKVIYNKTYDLLFSARAAIVTSGTATLETALFRVPQMVVYKMNAVSYWLIKMIIQVKFISLVNLIANKEVVSEFIHRKANLFNVDAELQELLEGEKRTKMLQAYEGIIEKLETGGSASHNTALLLVEDLKSKVLG